MKCCLEQIYYNDPIAMGIKESNIKLSGLWHGFVVQRIPLCRLHQITIRVAWGIAVIYHPKTGGIAV